MKLDVKIPFHEGLHARPASELVKICQKAVSDIELIKGDISVNPKSILGVISLGAGFDEEITVEVNGSDEEEVMEKIKLFFQA